LRKFKLTYILLILLQVLFACGTVKHVPENRFLLKKNSLEVVGGTLNEDEVNSIIRQQPNTKSLGLKLKLWVFNNIDSAKVAEKRKTENLKISRLNSKRKARENRINQKRISKAIKKGSNLYVKKDISLKDSIEPRLFLREWAKYKIGEVPVVFDSIVYNKSLEQLNSYVKNKGFLKGQVTGDVHYKKRKRVNVTYRIMTNQLYSIDSLEIICSNSEVKGSYLTYIKKNESHNLVGKAFDTDYLDDYRYDVARYMRDDALYGFSPSHISFEADTFSISNKVILKMYFTDRMIRSEANRDSLIPRKHAVTTVKDVYFHIVDTNSFDGNFKSTVESMGLTILNNNYLRTIDTFNYQKIKLKHSDELDLKREATFYFNGELFLDPSLMEVQNFLEKGSYYKDKYLDRSYSYLQQLGLFQNVKVIIEEIPNSNMIEVHYYLIPAKKQSFSFIPRGSTSNGFLGVTASVNYTNKNMFQGAEKLTFAISGGFESQPPIFDKTEDGSTIQKSARSFNTFEIGPSVKLELPGLYPIKSTQLYKRQRARTIISSAYNYQNRADFSREIFQLNYTWKFLSPDRTQVFQVGLPFVSVIKFVNIKKSDAFKEKLNSLNDLFLKNTFSDQFIWQDLKLAFEYKNTEKEHKSKSTIYFSSSFDLAGNTLSLFRGIQDTSTAGEYQFRGLVYSQFARLDNQFNFSYPITKNRSIHLKGLLGGGLPYDNTNTSMPYDYSFFAGGANDNRGWRARTLGPGGYKYYLDTNAISTQVGDLRIGGSVEYRFSFGSLLKGALFVDAGNIWTIRKDDNRPGSQFSRDWSKQIAIATGFGLRFDFEFFILRLDLGFPIHNPALPKGSDWVFQPKTNYYKELDALNYSSSTKANLSTHLFTPTFNFGIGYPF
jgi:outer membrane protein assembly factor BamA